jgi:NADPH:quinone reductase
MRAVTLRAFGPPDGLRIDDVPEPVAGPGEVVVAVEYASVTYVETQVRAGTPPNPAMKPVLPTILGNGVGGTVDSVGPDVDPSLVGRRVITTTGGSGGYAERVAVDAEGLIDVPIDTPMDVAVALLADGRTAMLISELAALRPGERVLVEAAAGGLGSLLVQLGRNAGATVVAAAGGARKVALAESLGANVAIDYIAPGWTARVRDEVGPVDVVLDGVGGTIGAESFGLLADGGRFVQYGMASGSFTAIPGGEADRRRITIVRFAPRTPEELRELTRRALGEAASGRLRPVIGQTYSLEHAADAHAAIAARATVGKTLLRTASD